MSDDEMMAAIRAELARREALSPAEREMLEIRAELRRRGVLPPPNPDLVEITGELGRRYKNILDELDQKIAEHQGFAVSDPAALMTQAVEALVQAVSGMTEAIAA